MKQAWTLPVTTIYLKLTKRQAFLRHAVLNNIRVWEYHIQNRSDLFKFPYRNQRNTKMHQSIRLMVECGEKHYWLRLFTLFRWPEQGLIKTQNAACRQMDSAEWVLPEYLLVSMMFYTNKIKYHLLPKGTKRKQNKTLCINIYLTLFHLGDIIIAILPVVSIPKT